MLVVRCQLLAQENVGVPEGMNSYSRTIPGTKIAFDMVAIPGGKFCLGSPSDEPNRRENEGPQATIRVEPFWIGKHEVTWDEYRQFMNLCNVFDSFNERGIRQLDDKHGVDAVTVPSKLYEPDFNFAAGDKPNQPAVSMSQYATKQYTKWLSLLTGEFYRLPTEVEWEYACRAGSTTAYGFGEVPVKLDQYAWYLDNADDQTHAVGSKKPNAWGLFDMHGNACEWVLDEYRADWYVHLQGPPIDAEPRFVGPSGSIHVYCGVALGISSPRIFDQPRRRESNDDEWRAYDPNSPQSPWWFASDLAQDVGFRILRPLDPPPRDEWPRYWDADLDQIQTVVDHRIDDEGRGERGKVAPSMSDAIKNLNSQAPSSR